MNCVFVTNIPTPYRVSMWNQLLPCTNAVGKRFIVLFMNSIEPNRDWIINEKLRFNHKLWNMWVYSFHGIYLRFNIFYVLDSIKGHDHIILGGSWNDLNVLSIVLLKRLKLIKSKISFWTEANHQTVGARRSSKIKAILRKFVLNTADGFYFIPGEMSLITLEKWGVNCRERTVNLPNLPHASFDKNIDTWIGGQAEKPVLTIVARLDEPIKGIKNFLKSLGPERLSKITVFIIGTGPDRDSYEKFINDSNLTSNIFLLGNLNIDDVISKLKVSDVFVLPSFSDPSPLTLIEACKIGLPLLVSNRCGNHYECLSQGENGYLFDPDNESSIQNAFDNLLSRRKEWKNFSAKSVEISNLNFNTSEVLNRLSKKL